MQIIERISQLAILPVFLSVFLIGCSSSRKSISSSSASSNFGTPTNALQVKFGTLIGVSPNKISNAALYVFIDKWLNTRYKYGSQNDKEIDCSAFTQILYEAVYHKKLPRTSEAQYQASSGIGSVKNLSEGDLVFFATAKGKKISHVGVYLQNNKFVNATNKGVLISDMNLPYWKESFVAGARINE